LAAQQQQQQQMNSGAPLQASFGPPQIYQPQQQATQQFGNNQYGDGTGKRKTFAIITLEREHFY
jgi:hypothetical protein